MLETERLVIRRFTPTDLADFLAYQGDPVVRRHMQGEPMSTEQAVDYLAAQAVLEEDKPEAWHGYAVQHRADNRVIGDVGVWISGKPERAGTGDVGFQFHPDYHGQGYAREAMQTFLPYVFGLLPQITATCNAANKQSWGLMERLGMHMLEKTGDEVQYGLTRDQWSAAG